MKSTNTNLTPVEEFALDQAHRILWCAFPDVQVHLIGNQWHIILEDDERFGPRQPLRAVPDSPGRPVRPMPDHVVAA